MPALTDCQSWPFHPRTFPRVVTRLTDQYVTHRKSGESFKDFIKRIGKVEIKSLLEDLTRLARR